MQSLEGGGKSLRVKSRTDLGSKLSSTTYYLYNLAQILNFIFLLCTIE